MFHSGISIHSELSASLQPTQITEWPPTKGYCRQFKFYYISSQIYFYVSTKKNWLKWNEGASISPLLVMIRVKLKRHAVTLNQINGNFTDHEQNDQKQDWEKSLRPWQQFPAKKLPVTAVSLSCYRGRIWWLLGTNYSPIGKEYSCLGWDSNPRSQGNIKYDWSIRIYYRYV